MLGRLPSLTIVRLLAALLLATIGLQASQSFDTVLRPSHGSTFSAATYDVALTPLRRTEAARPAATPLPAGALPVAPFATALPTVPLIVPPAPRPDSTGPPARLILDRQPAPRAPPAA